MNILKKINWNYFIISVLIICLIVMFINNVINKNKCNVSHNIEQEVEEQNPTEGFNDTNNNTNNKQDRKLKDELILYYASWCGYSKEFLPEWEKFVKFAKDNLANIMVTTVKCEGDNEAKCFQKGVEGYPTVIFYLKDGTAIPYDGARTTDKLIEFVNNKKST